ncbi:MAG: bis(5'-nucleosyl)-tetraphosphatase (symmetrical) YqeK [SAR202 cluster bacterium]|nr:bis(5'-nucleosyl)-tetraphosphatase (symmetrical) YqeK [SAR202 cluster bacterium]|tara:strand:- start:3464 stop:4030 length:567 start_codon:yes stop_codon:yes gene_type:complete
MPELLSKLNDYLNGLTVNLQNHLHRTAKLGRELSLLHDVNDEKVFVACIAHDIAKKLDVNEMLQESKLNKLTISYEEENSPILMHGPLAASWLEKNFKCNDQEILDSVFFHTTGRPYMSQVEKLVFLADKVEPNKVERTPDLQEVLDLCFLDLDAAIVKYIDMKIQQLLNQGKIIHPLAIQTRNFYMK